MFVPVTMYRRSVLLARPHLRWLSAVAARGGSVPRIGELRTAYDVLQAHKRHALQMGPMDVSSCWNTLGKLVRQRAEEREWMKAELRRGATLAPLLESTLLKLPRFQPRPVANAVHGLAGVVSATGYAPGEHVWEALAAKSLSFLNQFSTQALANTAWAYATAQHPAPALFDAIAAEAAPRMHQFDPQALTNTAWAYATAQHASPDLLNAIAAEAAPRVREFKPQALTNMAWAYTTAQLPVPELLDAIAEEAATRVRDFDPQHLAITAWAFAKAEHAAPKLLDAIAAEAAPRVREFNPQHLANTAWADAKAQHAAPKLLDAIAAEATPRVRKFEPQNLANMAWAYATAEHAAPKLLDAIAAEAAPRVREFDPQALASTAWAFATAQHAAPKLLDAIAAEAVPRGHEFNQLQLANMAWAYAAADHGSSDALFGTDAFVARCEAIESTFPAEGLCQLHQWQLWLVERGEAWPRLPPLLAERCHAAFVAAEGRPSRLQRQVGAALKALGHEPREEVRTPQGYSLDVVVCIEGREVAIEVDGPSHFVGRTHVPTGATALKWRQLRAAGWALVAVPYWQWNALDVAGQREFLLRELAAVRASGGKGDPMRHE